jgi:hypothetical protein
MAESVKVAVRVRPFNSREIERNAKVIIEMTGSSTTIRDPEDPSAEPKLFSFDFSYWSHDCFDTNAEGVMVPKTSKYADQQKVFDDLGRGVLTNAFAGVALLCPPLKLTKRFQHISVCIRANGFWQIILNGGLWRQQGHCPPGMRRPLYHN